MVKEMHEEACISGKSNDSIRATGASCLYQRRFAEKNIQMHTGYETVEALTYMRSAATLYSRVASEVGRLCRTT